MNVTVAIALTAQSFPPGTPQPATLDVRLIANGAIAGIQQFPVPFPTSVTFQNVTPGPYTLQIEARAGNPAGTVIGTAYTQDITVPAPAPVSVVLPTGATVTFG